MRHTRRAPPRFFGYTKAQILDQVAFSNAKFCVFFGCVAVPVLGFWTYRYVSVSKPFIEQKQAERREELLSEGRPEQAAASS